jgi:thymidylate kinase
MIICLEGPSAVGKTTTCSAIAEQMGAYIVPEVNAIFERPADASPNWYLECQVARWEIAQRQQEQHGFAVLDGDLFQPLWYNWAYDFVNWQNLDALSQFFRPLIQAGSLDFPDYYFCLFTNEDELKRRKEADQTRTRRNFESHLRLAQVQSRYFSALSRLASSMVHQIEAVSVEENIRSIEAKIAMPLVTPRNDLSLFDGSIGWLQSNKA